MKKLPLVASIVAAMALLAACRSVPSVNLTQAGARSLHEKTLTHAVYAEKGFTALTAGDVILSFGANMAENGEKIAEKY
ncbi:MAG: hypothetical protein L0H29_04315, partial [Sinobacteraceae bacterium]|nr:hypothetical protein [Nevskiaceae bacterium]